MLTRERDRAREPEAYEKSLEYDRRHHERSLNGRAVVRGEDTPPQPTRLGWLRSYMLPERMSDAPAETMLNDWVVWVLEIHDRSARLRHQGGMLAYVVEGRGYSLVNGERLEWETGDVIALPIQPGGVECQHINTRAGGPTKLLFVINPSLWDWTASDLWVLENSPDFADEGRDWRGAENAFEQLLSYTREERSRNAEARTVIRGEDVQWRQNRQALVRRYTWTKRVTQKQLPAALDDWRIFVQNIKVHSGCHRHQGGLVIFVLEGEGYSVVEGERHDWEAGDLLLLPLKPDGGVEHQHFNRYDDRPAKWIAFVNSSMRAWLGSEIVQVTHHPDYKEED